jgi:RNA polymerase sigma-70 factor (sigma-E family)
VRGIRAAARANRGTRDAEFTDFVQAASPSLLRAALVLLDSREDAEDALQITMLRTYRRWEQAKEAPQAYARTVLVNVCRERWRHHKRHPEISHEDVGELTNVVSFAEHVDRRHVLVRVLRQLPDIQREVLVCRYLLDATVAETAAALDIAEGTVKSAASRGLGQLRQLLYDEEKRGRRVHPA